MPDDKIKLSPYSPTLQDSTSNSGFRPSTLSFNSNSDDINQMLLARGVADVHRQDWYNNFSRFGVIDPYNAVNTTREYIFITRPDLHIVQTANPSLINPQLANNPFFVDFVERFPNIVRQLQSSADPNGVPFMAILSNAVTSGLDLPSISSDTIETSANVYGTTISYLGTSMKSDEQFDFSMEFLDTKYLEIYHLFKAYSEYKKLEWLGYMEPSTYDPDYMSTDDERWLNYTINKVLYDHVTAYKIVVGEDGMSIIFYARITGVSFNGVPRDAFSDMNNNDGQRLTIPMKGFYVRDSDPRILTEFNRLTYKFRRAKTTRDLPLFNTDTMESEGRWAKCPYIAVRPSTSSTMSTKQRMQKYYLAWRY